MPGDAQKSFDYLHDSVPKWIENLETIRARLVLARDGSDATRQPLERVEKRQRSGSMESLRPDDERKVIMAGAGLSPVGQPKPTTVEPTTPLSTPIKRKRNVPSILSGILKYRSRHMVVVQYDGEVQKAFESLVRCIGTGRNLLRKGKMAAKMEALAASMPSDDDDSVSSGDNEINLYGPKSPRYKNGYSAPRMRSHRSPFAPLQDDGDAFDTTDKELEHAQGLCEKGAHQFLRDGDCSRELDMCKDYFLKIANISDRQLAIYASRQEAKMAREAQEKEEAETDFDAVSLKRNSFRRLSPDMDLEVDDDEDGAYDAAAAIAAMKAIQRPRRIPLRAEVS